VALPAGPAAPITLTGDIARKSARRSIAINLAQLTLLVSKGIA
jgi:hypothetical protein